ncbi:hypothetical protein [Streptosporangium canum]
MEHIAASMKAGLLALAVQSGLAVMFALLEEDVIALCGPRGKHNPERTAVRHGHDAGSVVLGGRRLPGRGVLQRHAQARRHQFLPSPRGVLHHRHHQRVLGREVVHQSRLGHLRLPGRGPQAMLYS